MSKNTNSFEGRSTGWGITYGTSKGVDHGITGSSEYVLKQLFDTSKTECLSSLSARVQSLLDDYGLKYGPDIARAVVRSALRHLLDELRP